MLLDSIYVSGQYQLDYPSHFHSQAKRTNQRKNKFYDISRKSWIWHCWCCLAGYKYDNDWEALLTAKLEKQATKCISDPKDDSTSSVCEDEFESETNKDGTQINEKYQLYQKFNEIWVKEFLQE